MGDPFSAAVGALSIAQFGGHAVRYTRDIRANYKDADKQIKHAKAQLEMFQSNLESITYQSHENTSVAQSSFDAIGQNFPGDLSFNSRRARLKWAAKNKEKVAELIGQMKETEISTILTLLLNQSALINQLHTTLLHFDQEFALMKEVDLVKGQMDYPELNIAVEPPNHSLDVTVQSWDSRLRSFLGVTAGMIVTTSKGKSKYNIFFRLPLFWSTALNCRVETYWPSWSHLSIAPLLKIQHIISENSITLAACIRDDVPELRNLLLSGKAHPNDTTLDNETLLYFAIRANCINATKLLLEFGADPNLTYGRWETSALNTAFYYGNINVVRLLLDFQADIRYINRRRWSSARYIYDSQGINPYSLELLDICVCLGLDQWDSQDGAGWTVLHRASAFGQGSDIEKLLNLRANSKLITYTLKWLPISCAVAFGNESTFATLVGLIQPQHLRKLKDSRGWTLLHIAAENGSEAMITRLLLLKFDPFAKSNKSTICVPKGLPFEEFTPGEIAKFCNNHVAYDRAMKNTGHPIMSSAN